MIRMFEVIPSFLQLSTGALLVASVVQISLLTLLVGRSRRRRQPRYLTLPTLAQAQDEENPIVMQPQPEDAQQRAAWKGAMLRRFEGH